MLAAMLCVVPGNTAATQLAKAGLGDERLVWRDILHEGPVPAGLDLAALGAVRARFLAAAGWTTEAEALAAFAERDRALARFDRHDEVVLWLDGNLVNQLQLLQLLDWFAGREISATRLAPRTAWLAPSAPRWRRSPPAGRGS